MEQTRETTPDELLENFRGSSFGKILIFTIVAHAALLLVGIVVPWLWGLAAGPKVADLTEEQRLELAVKEARASMSDIAKEYGLNSPDALSRQMAGGAKPPPKSTAAENETGPGDRTGEGEDPADGPKSAIEEEIEKVEEGPTVPPVPEEEDLFR